MNIVSRKDARAAGETRYFTGKSCVRGHVDKRMVSSGVCCTCLSENKKKYRAENPHLHKEYMIRWHAENAEKELQYRIDNAEKISIRVKQWREANADRHAENAKNWRINNKSRSDQNRREWRRKNPDRAAMLAKRWRMNNPKKQRIIMFNRNCITRGLRHIVKHGAIERLFMLQNGKCTYCKTSVSEVFDIDHITPVSRGGDNNEHNLQLLCPSCNRSKRDKTHEEYVRWREQNATV